MSESPEFDLLTLKPDFSSKASTSSLNVNPPSRIYSRLFSDAPVKGFERYSKPGISSGVGNIALSRDNSNSCPVCGKNMIHMNSSARHTHVDVCMSVGEKSKKFDKKMDEWKKTEDCPLCKQPQKSGPMRATHIKRCALKYGVNPKDILSLVQAQQNVTEALKTKKESHTSARVPKIVDMNVKRRRDVDLPKNIFDEQMKTAIALSASELNSPDSTTNDRFFAMPQPSPTVKTEQGMFNARNKLSEMILANRQKNHLPTISTMKKTNLAMDARVTKLLFGECENSEDEFEDKINSIKSPAQIDSPPISTNKISLDAVVPSYQNRQFKFNIQSGELEAENAVKPKENLRDMIAGMANITEKINRDINIRHKFTQTQQNKNQDCTKLSVDLMKLFDEGIDFDANIKFRDLITKNIVNIQVHKLIFKARCNIQFKELTLGSMKNSAVLSIIKFVYSGIIAEIEQEDLPHVIYLAQRFGLNEICERFPGVEPCFPEDSNFETSQIVKQVFKDTSEESGENLEIKDVKTEEGSDTKSEIFENETEKVKTEVPEILIDHIETYENEEMESAANKSTPLLFNEFSPTQKVDNGTISKGVTKTTMNNCDWSLNLCNSPNLLDQPINLSLASSVLFDEDSAIQQIIDQNMVDVSRDESFIDLTKEADNPRIAVKRKSNQIEDRGEEFEKKIKVENGDGDCFPVEKIDKGGKPKLEKIKGEESQDSMIFLSVGSSLSSGNSKSPKSHANSQSQIFVHETQLWKSPLAIVENIRNVGLPISDLEVATEDFEFIEGVHAKMKAKNIVLPKKSPKEPKINVVKKKMFSPPHKKKITSNIEETVDCEFKLGFTFVSDEEDYSHQNEKQKNESDKLAKGPVTPAENGITVVKTENITPLPDYKSMDTPGIKKELGRFGLRAMGRKKATPLLMQIYEKTHPIVDDLKNGETSKTSDKNIGESDVKLNMEVDCLEESMTYEKQTDSQKDRTKTRAPEEQLKQMILNNEHLLTKSLMSEPIPFEEIYEMMKEELITANKNELMDFLDKQGIIFTIKSKRNEKNSQKRMKNKKN